MAERKQSKSNVRAADGPPKKRGRPKGLPKTGGRQAKTLNWTAPEVREQILPAAAKNLMRIMSGEPIETSGPSGKRIFALPSIDQRLSAAEVALRKTMPDLAATALDVKSEQVQPEQHATRDVARSVLSVLRRAEITKQQQWAPPPQEMKLR